jgi:hypothetical protein
MSRLAHWIVAASLAAGALGCCAGPCRFYENAYGWNNPDTETYCPGPPPPVTTPPGYSTPVDPDQIAAESGRPSRSVLPQSADPSDLDGPEVLPPPEPTPPGDTSPSRLAPPLIMPAGYSAPSAFPGPRWVLE